MSTRKLAKINNPWTIRIPSFSQEQRNALEAIAKSRRMNIGAYVGNLLEEVIKSSEKNQTTLSLSFLDGSPVTPSGRDEAFISQ